MKLDSSADAQGDRPRGVLSGGGDHSRGQAQDHAADHDPISRSYQPKSAGQ